MDCKLVNANKFSKKCKFSQDRIKTLTDFIFWLICMGKNIFKDMCCLLLKYTAMAQTFYLLMIQPLSVYYSGSEKFLKVLHYSDFCI